jgi:hypothetical protein
MCDRKKIRRYFGWGIWNQVVKWNTFILDYRFVFQFIAAYDVSTCRGPLLMNPLYIANHVCNRFLCTLEIWAPPSVTMNLWPSCLALSGEALRPGGWLRTTVLTKPGVQVAKPCLLSSTWAGLGNPRGKDNDFRKISITDIKHIDSPK